MKVRRRDFGFGGIQRLLFMTGCSVERKEERGGRKEARIVKVD